MTVIVPWVLRAGALLAIVSVFIPHAEVGGRGVSPVGAVGILRPLMPSIDFGAHAAWLLAPAAAGAIVLAGATRAGRRLPVCRGAAVAFSLAAAFALATQGSILLTHGEAAGTYPFALALFVLPLLAAVVVVARVLGGAAPETTAGVARLSIGVFTALNGFFLRDWWTLLALWTSNTGLDGLSAGAWAGPVAGFLVAAGEAASLFRPAPAAGADFVDTPVAPG